MVVDLVVFFNLGQNHFRGNDRAPRIVHVMIMPLPVAHFLLDHVRADGVEPLGITGNLGNGNMTLIKPGFGWGRIIPMRIDARPLFCYHPSMNLAGSG